MILTENAFTAIGRDGLGNPRSKVAHCLAYFKKHLYVGLTHHRGEGPEDRARILRYAPENGQWEEVYISPLVTADQRADPQDVLRSRRRQRIIADKVPEYRGFRSMAVFQGKSDREPALYVSTICHWGARILRSADGLTFKPVSEPGLGNANLLSFRSLTGFKGKLFTAPTGSIEAGKMDRNFSGDPMIYVSADPARGSWQPAMEPGFGDPANTSISQMMMFNDHLYASAGNSDMGFQIWKTRAEGDPPYVWQPVLLDGAHRYNLNETASTMAVFRNALYVSSGLPGLGYDSANDVGPAAMELLRLHPDDSWDLMAGSPRFTPDGLKVPFGLMGPGFDDFYNSVLWAMEVHDNVLYVGSHHWLTFQDVMHGRPPSGGFQLWASEDGDTWNAVTRDGFGDPFEIGVRTLLSTPLGLVLGTSNHQEIIDFKGSGARPERDEIINIFGPGGCEVWLGG